MNSMQLRNQAVQNEQLCIWMQADVVPHKFCRLEYQCAACAYDRAMRRVAAENKRLKEQDKIPIGKRGRIVFWKDKLRELPAWKQPCLHHMIGHIEFRACTHDYQCGDCEFDQYFNDQFAVHAVVQPVDVLDIKGFKIPHGFYLHPGHTWVKIEEGSTVRVGLDDFAMRLFGPLDQIEAPLMGKQLEQGRDDISLRREGNNANLLSPVSGVVTDINPALRERGSRGSEDAYSESWILRLHCTNLRQDLKNLMIGDQASEYLDEEVNRLYEVIEETAGPLATDGGYLGDDIFGNLPQLGWQKLTRLFLRT
ncbi:MAG: glycine cleavage system protein H [Desulfobacterales bacterium]|jgi:glycine cleavage system H lipoate-binding protein|nr:glycine cleavage system protein H [Deltaproteobacteria bacterium]